ncbi:MAG: response regulator, partial [Thiohalocapsa sp.]|nr:response regulator [Thiohalocapsa sp.]
LEMLSQTELDREQQRFVETAVGSPESLLTVINDILDFSKIEAGKLDLEHIPFDIRPLAEDITTLLAPRAAERSFELACYVAPDIDTRVIGDPTRLRQVLNNLVGNAVKFTEHGEVLLRISADETAEHAAEAINTLRFEIIDTGIGMTEEALRRLFSPFEQADGSTTRRFGGTGLGLAIVKQLVELMGGRISAESTPGEGSTFRFTIPFERQPAAAQDPARADLAGLRVLAVDDNATNLTILGHYLRSWGVEAGTAADGFEALARLREAEDAGKPYDIAVLDMQMPQIDGLALARLIKSEPSIAGTRLIMISSIGQTDVEVRAAGIQYALSKPIRQSHLHDSLQELAGGRERLPQQDAGPQPAADDAPGLEGHVLLAEDNPVNQRVALSMLKRLGLTADVTADGLQAVEMACARDYRLILMDCQMPTLDGFEATAELRRREAGQPADHATEHRIVTAWTANAMAGDREHCIPAGMDDYLAKPIKTAQLRACLTRWLAGQRAEPHAPRTAAMPGPLPAPAPSLPAADAGPGGCAPPEQLSVDPDAMENLKDLLADGYGRSLQLYEQKTRELTNRLHEGLAQHDIGTIEAAAHALKGSAGNIGAGELQTLAQAIEHKAKAGDLNGMELLLELAGRAQRQVLDDVARISAGESPAGRDVE